ncbi:MAG TPA: arylsulfatase [Luteolibacter sp.]|nr:arylsulfatase [Luteolibacter sp.]
MVILADDLGYGDLGCYNPESKIPTPNLDRLAASGIRLTNAYCPASVCSPTRYSLMTGAYPWRSWKKRGVLGNWDRPMISEGQPTLPSVLADSGYVTGGFGKWHLGANYRTRDGQPPVGTGDFKGSGENIDLSQPVNGGPMDRGFSEWSGMICSSELLMVDGRKISARLSHELYKPLTMPGYNDLPELAVAELLPRATKQSVDFIRRGAKGEKPFFLYFAPYVPHIPLAVAEDFKGKTKAGDYGDYVHELDHHIGMILAALDETGVRDRTLVIFATDNGSQFETTGEGHHPNGGLRGGKWKIHEGGVRTPFIASWPGKIPAASESTALLSLSDVLPTLVAATNGKMPEGAAPDGLDLWPVLLGNAVGKPIRSEIMLRASVPDGALRQGDWKFIKRGKGKPELYNLVTDPAEKNDLATAEPARLAAMGARFEELMKDSQKNAP